MTPNAKLSETLALVATIDPQTVVNSEVFSDYVDMREFEEVLFVGLLGNMAAETIDLEIIESTDTSAGGAQVLKKIVQLAANASNNDLKQVKLNVRMSELTSGYRYVRARAITGNSSGGPAAVVAFGALPRYGPAAGKDLATVVQTIG